GDGVQLEEPAAGWVEPAGRAVRPPGGPGPGSGEVRRGLRGRLHRGRAGVVPGRTVVGVARGQESGGSKAKGRDPERRVPLSYWTLTPDPWLLRRLRPELVGEEVDQRGRRLVGLLVAPGAVQQLEGHQGAEEHDQDGREHEDGRDGAPR